MNEIYICFPGFVKKALTLSYDDGVRQDKRLIEIMKRHGLKGTFNINSGLFSDSYNGVEKGRMTKEECLDLYVASGMEVAIHGYRHISLTKVESALALNDIVTDRKELEKMFGRVVTGMAYAFGTFNDDIVSFIGKAGVNYARTTISTEKFDIPSDWLRLPTTCHHNNPRLMELAKEFVESTERNYWHGTLKLFYLWGHSYEFDDHNNWDVIENFAEYIGCKEDIWYATNGEIFDYLKACENLRFSIDGTLVCNLSGIDIYIDYMNKKHIIPAGKTICIETGEIS